MSDLAKRLETLFYEADFVFKQPAPTFAVVGAGVEGLSTALALHKVGARVVVLTAQESVDNTQEHVGDGTYPITSQVAGALWEYPPAVCGAHSDLDTDSKSKTWSIVTYRAMRKMVEDPALFPFQTTGVQMLPSTFFYYKKVKPQSNEEFAKENPTLGKMTEIATNPYITGFDYNGDDNHLVNYFRKLNPPMLIDDKVVDGFSHDAALVESSIYLGFLRSLIHASNIPVVNGFVINDLYADKGRIDHEFTSKGLPKPDVYINTTGVQSNYTVHDKTAYARRGAVYVFPYKGPHVHPGVESIKNLDELKKHAFCVPVSELNGDDPQADPDVPAHFAFVIPRGDHSVIVGGFSEALDQAKMDKSFEYYRNNKRMDAGYTQKGDPAYQERIRILREKAVAFLQPVRDLFEVHKDNLDQYLITGLRPFRLNGPRLEYETQHNVIHNYGHGGSGVSWSLGCATEVAHLARKVVTAARAGVTYHPHNANIKEFLAHTKKVQLFAPIHGHKIGDVFLETAEK